MRTIKYIRHVNDDYLIILRIQNVFAFSLDLKACIHTWSELLVPLVNMIKEGCENKCALLILLNFYLKKSQKSKRSLENKNLKWGKISL